jgi:hypothetical protein
MRNWRSIRVGVAIVLNLTDLFVVFFLVLGGWNATVSHPVTGYVAIVFAPVLMYLSAGLWAKGHWRSLGRIVLYGGAFLVVGVSAVVLLSVHAAPSEGKFVVYMALSILLLEVLLSIVHFRLLMRERLSNRPQIASQGSNA